jgi:hypothetical protein
MMFLLPYSIDLYMGVTRDTPREIQPNLWVIPYPDKDPLRLSLCAVCGSACSSLIIRLPEDYKLKLSPFAYKRTYNQAYTYWAYFFAEVGRLKSKDSSLLEHDAYHSLCTTQCFEEYTRDIAADLVLFMAKR